MTRQFVKARCELLVKEVIYSDFTWTDIENLFCINRNILIQELQAFIKTMSNSVERMKLLEAKIEFNLRKKQKSVELERERC